MATVYPSLASTAGDILPFYPTDPAGDHVAWTGADMIVEFRNGHSADIEVSFPAAIAAVRVVGVGRVPVPDRIAVVPAGQDVAFFFEEGYVSAYLDESVRLPLNYDGGNSALLIRVVSFGTGTGSNDPPLPPPLSISGSPSSGREGVAYSFVPTVSNAQGSTTFALTGSLPAGLSFDTSTGTISGTPTTAGVTAGLSIAVTDDVATASLGPFSLTILPPSAGEDMAWGADQLMWGADALEWG